eukprot:139935_1
MAESDNDSFVLIEQLNTEGTVGTASIDGWSEISAPSNKSLPTKATTATSAAFSLFNTNYLRTSADAGYCIVPTAISHDLFLSNSTTNDHEEPQLPVTSNMNIRNHSIGSVGSRVPFSWAEITKIQPFFHNDQGAHKPKVFEQTPKIKTRYTSDTATLPKQKAQPKAVSINESSDYYDNHEMMPSIPESDPFATKSDLGRRVRRAGKRGSRLKYPNGKKGKKNGRKKSSK